MVYNKEGLVEHVLVRHVSYGTHPNDEVVTAVDGDAIIAHVCESVLDESGSPEGATRVEAVGQRALQGGLPRATAAHRTRVGDHLIVDVHVAGSRLLVDAEDCAHTPRN